jgi:hypothetical protein
MRRLNAYNTALADQIHALLRDQHGIPITATQVADRLHAHLGIVWMRLHDLEEFGQASRVEVAEQDLLYWVAATRPAGGGHG